MKWSFIRGTFFKYWQNKIFKTDISSAVHLRTKWCFFVGILYTFKVCKKSLLLKCFQCIIFKNECKFPLRYTCVGEFSFIIEKKPTLLIIKSQSASSLSVQVAFPTFCVKLMWLSYFNPFLCYNFVYIFLDRLLWLKIWNCLEYLLYYGVFPVRFGICRVL